MGKRLQEIQKQLLEKISGQVASHRFKGPRQQTFFRDFPDGWTAFHLAFIPHDGTDLDTTADVAIRFEPVEALVNQGNRLLKSAEKARTATLGAELGNIAEGSPWRWKIEREEDVEAVAQEIQMAFQSVGLSYIETFSDMEHALGVLSNNGPQGWLHSPIHGGRCKRALALAFVLKDRSKFEEIAQSCRDFLEERKDVGLAVFLRFEEELRKRFARSG